MILDMTEVHVPLLQNSKTKFQKERYSMSKCCDKRKICCKDKEFIKSDTYADCIHHAFYDENGKKFPHQYRIPNATLDAYKTELLPLEKEFMSSKDFDKIYELFKKHKTYGIGILTIYDVALRVSQNYKIYPDYVYLHAGTKTGALNAGLIKKYGKNDKLTLDEISKKLKWLKGVKPYLIEDFLCVYKDDISEKSLQTFLQK